MDTHSSRAAAAAAVWLEWARGQRGLYTWVYSAFALVTRSLSPLRLNHQISRRRRLKKCGVIAKRRFITRNNVFWSRGQWTGEIGSSFLQISEKKIFESDRHRRDKDPQNFSLAAKFMTFAFQNRLEWIVSSSITKISHFSLLINSANDFSRPTPGWLFAHTRHIIKMTFSVYPL
jgi:hypothetical protein